MPSLLVLAIVIVSAVDAFHIHPTGGHRLNKIEEWSSELDLAPNDLTWQADVPDVPDNKELYHWVEDDVVEKSRSDGLLRLPGGCELTPAQYKRLLEFRRGADYVQNCYCQEGGVYCKLKKNGQHVQIT